MCLIQFCKIKFNVINLKSFQCNETGKRKIYITRTFALINRSTFVLITTVVGHKGPSENKILEEICSKSYYMYLSMKIFTTSALMMQNVDRCFSRMVFLFVKLFATIYYVIFSLLRNIIFITINLGQFMYKHLLCFMWY